jgi:hypothetical protein
MPHDSMALEESAAHTATAVTGCRTVYDGEAIRQATRLATWEDEGGSTSSGLQPPRERSDARSERTANEGMAAIDAAYGRRPAAN